MSATPPKSERIVVAAPMSYAGSAQRVWKLTRITENVWLRAVLGALAVVLVALAWVVVTLWYVLFSLLLLPYRLIRRGQRKRKVDAARHREMLDAASK